MKLIISLLLLVSLNAMGGLPPNRCTGQPYLNCLPGNIINASTVPIGSGGTNATTNTAAFNNLAPSGPALGSMLYFDGSNWVNANGAVGVTQTVAASNIDWNAATIFHKFLSGATTFTFSNVKPGTVFINVTNTASNYTVAWPTSASGVPIGWPGGTVPTQTTGVHTDAYMFVSDGITIDATVIQNY